MTELGRGRRAPKKYPVVPTSSWNTDPGDARVFPTGRELLPSPCTGATLEGTAPHSGRHISVDIPVDIVVDNFVDQRAPHSWRSPREWRLPLMASWRCAMAIVEELLRFT
jgi:hypothetical protein